MLECFSKAKKASKAFLCCTMIPKTAQKENADLEIFLAPDEVESFVTFAVHIALDVQLGAEALGTTEEYASLAR